MTLKEKQARWAAIARNHGIRNPLVAIEEGHKVGIGPALAVAMLEQESGGRNVWGHDPTIFVGGYDRKHNKFWTKAKYNGYVNEAGYKEYRAQRRASGNRLMQGCGPMQLTWWEFQDGADRMGGCWKVRPNIRYGMTRLSGLMKVHGRRAGIMRYNGSGPAAVAYAASVMLKWAKWRLRFGIH